MVAEETEEQQNQQKPGYPVSTAADREAYMKKKVEPLSVDGLDKNALLKLNKEMHSKIAQVEESKYDIEFKIRNQNRQIYELNEKLREPGKFIKPALKKVGRTDLQFEKLEKKEHEKIKVELKATGKSKYALEGEEDRASQPRRASEGENLGEDMGEEEVEEEAEDEEEEEEE